MPLEECDGYTNGKHFAGDVMKALEGSSLDCSEEIPLSFFLYLPSESLAREAGAIIAREGFEVEVEEPVADDGRWLCWCDLSMVPNVEKFEHYGDMFLGLAETYNGDFDGWEVNPYKTPGGFEDLLQQMKGILGKEDE